RGHRGVHGRAHEHQHAAARELALDGRQGRRPGHGDRRAALERRAGRPAARADRAGRPHPRAAGARDPDLQAHTVMRAPLRTARLACAALCGALAALLCGTSAAQLPDGVPNISGAWERLGGLGGGGDSPHMPPREPPPPLKPEFRAEWEARREAARAADARGEPLATNYTFGTPDGRPGMRSGPFPFEILQSPGQVTIVQEAYNQIRRIYLDKPQLPLAEIEPGFYGRSVGEWRDDTLVVETIG